MTRTYPRPTARPTEPHLTPRECQLLEAIILTGRMGLAAARLGISYSTAKNTITRIRDRTGWRTSQMIAVGVRDGWLRVPDSLETPAA